MSHRSGYTLHTIADRERPIVILDPVGMPAFSFDARDADLANTILHRLNSPANEWPELEDVA